MFTTEYQGLGEDQRFPIGAEDDRMGFLVFGRQIEGENDYLIIVVAYKKSDPANTVSAVLKNPNGYWKTADGKYKLTFKSPGSLQLGSPLISMRDATYTRIVGASDNVAIVEEMPSMWLGTNCLYVVAESGEGVSKSPVLAFAASRTALRE
jgi:hypothetical protein